TTSRRFSKGYFGFDILGAIPFHRPTKWVQYKRRAHHSPYTCTLTTLTFPENNPLIQTVHGKSV
ncbi:hypothetical protein Q7I47_24755, partial [Escherichia coli]